MMDEFVVLLKVLGRGQLVGHGNHNNCVLSEQIFRVGLRFHQFLFSHAWAHALTKKHVLNILKKFSGTSK